MSGNTEKYDVIIIGAGPAGLTAAIYSAWLGLKTVVLESAASGGRAFLAPKIENFPGFPEGITGSELVDKMTQQAQRFKAEIRLNEEVVALEAEGKVKSVISRNGTYQAPAVIITTGTQRRKLRVPGENDFLGRGVSYCAVCDGPLFRGRSVAVVGNSVEAAVDAEALANLAAKVFVVSQEPQLEINGEQLNRLKINPNVQILMGKLTQISGEHSVSAVTLLQYPNMQEAQLTVQGVFIALGSVPLTAIVAKAGITTDRNGCLMVDRTQQTNVEGVFAAGDCTCGGMQVVTAAGEGAMAAMKTAGYIRRKAE
ncbi:MAG: FAD-dependent oxidoreductase [Candidatus Bathyarchaeota archaeon]|nr:FAD-dependent oxidoreductase [Candidatus Bathyarchaeota archaeon]